MNVLFLITNVCNLTWKWNKNATLLLLFQMRKKHGTILFLRAEECFSNKHTECNFLRISKCKTREPLTNYNFLNTFTIATLPYVTTAKAIPQLPQLNHSAMFSQSVLLAMQKWVEMSTPSVSKMIFSVHTAFRPSQVQHRMSCAATLYPEFWVIINQSHTSYNICF